VLAEVRALRQDVSEVEAGVKALGRSAAKPGRNDVKISKLHWPVIPALLLLCLTLSLTACTSAPPKSPLIIQEPLPESLTAKTETPAPPPRPMTYGNLVIWSDATGCAGYLQRR
jgi:hypothetical protein